MFYCDWPSPRILPLVVDHIPAGGNIFAHPPGYPLDLTPWKEVQTTSRIYPHQGHHPLLRLTQPPNLFKPWHPPHHAANKGYRQRPSSPFFCCWWDNFETIWLLRNEAFNLVGLLLLHQWLACLQKGLHLLQLLGSFLSLLSGAHGFFLIYKSCSPEKRGFLWVTGTCNLHFKRNNISWARWDSSDICEHVFLVLGGRKISQTWISPRSQNLMFYRWSVEVRDGIHQV